MHHYNKTRYWRTLSFSLFCAAWNVFPHVGCTRPETNGLHLSHVGSSFNLIFRRQIMRHSSFWKLSLPFRNSVGGGVLYTGRPYTCSFHVIFKIDLLCPWRVGMLHKMKKYLAKEVRIVQYYLFNLTATLVSSCHSATFESSVQPKKAEDFFHSLNSSVIVKCKMGVCWTNKAYRI
jgi:hypothetical protein